MFALTIVAIAVFGILAAAAIHTANQIVDREQRDKLIQRQVQRRYWNHRYPSGYWPGKERDGDKT